MRTGSGTETTAGQDARASGQAGPPSSPIATSPGAASAARGFAQTETATMRVRVGEVLVAVEIYVAINADTHPAIAERLRSAPPHLPALDVAGHWTELVLPIWYYEPGTRLCVLLLPPSLRYRELEERAHAIARLATLPRAVAIEPWMLAPEVATSPAELEVLRARRRAGAAAPPAMPVASNDGLASWQRSLDEQARELARRAAPGASWPARRAAAPPPADGRGDERSGDTSAAFDEPLSDPSLLGVVELEVAADEPPADAPPAAAAPMDERVAAASPAAAAPPPPTRDTIDEAFAGATPAVRQSIPWSAEPVVSEQREVAVAGHDPWLVEAMALGRHAVALEREGARPRVRLALSAALLPDPRALSGTLDVRIVLHRAPTYPVITLLVGAPAALRGDRRAIAVVCFDVMIERDRAVLTALSKDFELIAEPFANGRRQRRLHLQAPLADNVAYLVRAAKEHLQRLGERGLSISGVRAVEHVLHPEHDLLGWHHPYADELGPLELVSAAGAEQTRSALEMIRRFSEPAGEDYLLCTRGVPIPLWRSVRRTVLDRAVAWGLWPGPELARIAVSEGLARSRRHLVQQLHETFEARSAESGLEPEVIDENRARLEQESSALGLGSVRTPMIRSDSDAVVAGSIDLSSKDVPRPLELLSVEELVATLADAEGRPSAVRELCRRRATEAAASIIAALAQLPRDRLANALVDVLELGAAAEGPLVATLASTKRHLRQGAALVLGALQRDDANAALTDLLLLEPTEIWREVARALGQAGGGALTALAQAVARRGVTPRVEERVAWALAYLGAGEHRRAIGQISNGHSIMAPIAAKALALIEPAARDHRSLLSDRESKDEPRQLSHQFFVALARSQAGPPANPPAMA